jgi:hypothetical protein
VRAQRRSSQSHSFKSARKNTVVILSQAVG